MFTPIAFIGMTGGLAPKHTLEMFDDVVPGLHPSSSVKVGSPFVKSSLGSVHQVKLFF